MELKLSTLYDVDKELSVLYNKYKDEYDKKKKKNKSDDKYVLEDTYNTLEKITSNKERIKYHNCYPDSVLKMIEKYKKIYNGVTLNRFHVINVDISSSDFVSIFVKKHLSSNKYKALLLYSDISSIIHLPKYNSIYDSISNPKNYYDYNIKSILNIIEFSKIISTKYDWLGKEKVPIIFCSSTSVYSNIQNAKEDLKCDLNSITNPYTKTTLICEEMLKDVSKIVPSICLRIPKVIGYNDTTYDYVTNPNGQTEEVCRDFLNNMNKKDIHNFINSYSYINFPIEYKPTNIFYNLLNSITNKHEFVIHGNDYNTSDGTCIREYLDIRDLTEAINSALRYAKNTNFDIINISSDKGISIKELINTFEKVNNIKINYKYGERREGDIDSYTCNSEKAYKVLGWKPIYSLEESIKTIQL